uniref:Uncharacterized protein n=1 Tax=Arundo donax TaxID=35708 RepID=A0A0A8YQI6_ARUDO
MVLVGSTLPVVPVAAAAPAMMHMVGAMQGRVRRELFPLFGHFDSGVALPPLCLCPEPR